MVIEIPEQAPQAVRRRRPLMHGDVTAAARALLKVRRDRRAWVLHRMLAEAQRADEVRRSTGIMHPVWGDGSLMAAALRRPAPPEPSLEDAVYCRLLAFVYLALAQRAEGAFPLERDYSA